MLVPATISIGIPRSQMESVNKEANVKTLRKMVLRERSVQRLRFGWTLKLNVRRIQCEQVEVNNKVGKDETPSMRKLRWTVGRGSGKPSKKWLRLAVREWGGVEYTVWRDCGEEQRNGLDEKRSLNSLVVGKGEDPSVRRLRDVKYENKWTLFVESLNYSYMWYPSKKMTEKNADIGLIRSGAIFCWDATVIQFGQ